MKNFENHDHCINAEAEEKDGKDDGEVTEVVGGRKLCVNKPCKHHLRGYCKYGEQCRFVHTCKYFASTGTRRYGNTCKFVHIKKSGEKTQKPKRSGYRQRRGQFFGGQFSKGEAETTKETPVQEQQEQFNFSVPKSLDKKCKITFEF